MVEPLSVNPDGVRSLSQIHTDVAGGLGSLTAASPGAATVASSHGTVAYAVETALTAALGSRSGTMTATQKSGARIAELLQEAAKAYEHGDRRGAQAITAAAEAIASGPAPTGSTGAGAAAAGASASGGGADAIGQAVGQVGQLGQMGQQLGAPLSAVGQPLQQVPQQVQQAVQAAAQSAGDSSDQPEGASEGERSDGAAAGAERDSGAAPVPAGDDAESGPGQLGLQ